MLVIERGNQERFVVGKAGDVLTRPIVVQVLGFKKWNEESKAVARIGIEAQRDVMILREELIPGFTKPSTTKSAE